MDLPSFIWLWKMAAWSMGLSLLTYGILAGTGIWLYSRRKARLPRPIWLKPFHFFMGGILVLLVLFLLLIGIVGTLGHYGSLGHSSHLIAGLFVVSLVLISAISATQINPHYPWIKKVHVATNLILFIGFIFVSLTGWDVVQKYLP